MSCSTSSLGNQESSLKQHKGWMAMAYSAALALFQVVKSFTCVASFITPKY